MKHTKLKNQKKCHCGLNMIWIDGQWICRSRIRIPFPIDDKLWKEHYGVGK